MIATKLILLNLFVLFSHASHFEQCVDMCRHLPPPPMPNAPPPPGPVNQDMRMTQSFPLGSCRMGGPSLPYELEFTSSNAGSICFRIKLVEDYIDRCSARGLTGPCNMMVNNVNKIVIWYRQVNECGYDLTSSRNHLEVFPWNVRARSVVRAGRFRVSGPGAPRPHASGDIGMFKWINGRINSVQVDINKSGSFKRANDTSMHDYRLCLTYDQSVVNLTYCISSNQVIKYSFYDPFKTICTTGSVRY
jgi:hypothetical protein